MKECLECNSPLFDQGDAEFRQLCGGCANEQDNEEYA